MEKGDRKAWKGEGGVTCPVMRLGLRVEHSKTSFSLASLPQLLCQIGLARRHPFRELLFRLQYARYCKVRVYATARIHHRACRIHPSAKRANFVSEIRLCDSLCTNSSCQEH